MLDQSGRSMALLGYTRGLAIHLECGNSPRHAVKLNEFFSAFDLHVSAGGGGGGGVAAYQMLMHY